MHEPLMITSGWLLNHPPNFLLGYLAHSAVSLAMVGGMAWLGDRMLRRVGPQAQHRMWVAALLMSVALPLLPAGWLGRMGAAHMSAAGGTVAVTYHVVAAAAERWTVSPLLGAVLAAAYLLTVLIYMVRLLWRGRRTWAMARRAARLTLEPGAAGRMEAASRRLGTAAPEVRCSSETRGPVVLGLRRPVLLVPQRFFAAENGTDIAAALAHECAHIARWDFAKNLIYECAAAVVTYHPACWLMRRRIAETRELVCDEMASGAVGDRPEYAASLLRLATAMTARAGYEGGTQAIGVFDANILEERIMRMTTDLPKVSRTRKIAMAMVTACALLGGAVTAMALSFDVMPQDSTTVAAFPLTPQDSATPTVLGKEKIYHIGHGVTPPLLTHSVDAEFTKKAKDAKFQGVSVVQCIVDSHGMPQRVHTVRKLGMGLDEKALEAVRQYRFKPSTLNGKPVAVAITIEVNFHLY